MSKLTQSDLFTKWLHLAEKLIPPQADLSPQTANGGFIVAARWKDETNPDRPGNGIDLFFPQEMIDRYLAADASFELRLDAFIEDTITEKLKNFNADGPKTGASSTIERWTIAAGPAT